MKGFLATSPLLNASLGSLVAGISAILLAVAVLACDDGQDRGLELESTVESMNDSLDALGDENTQLKDEITTLQQRRLEDRETRIGELEQPNLKANADLPDKERWFVEDKARWTNGEKKQLSNSKDDRLTMQEDSAVEATARMAEDAGGQVDYIEHAGRSDRTVLVTPREFVDGETPLIVSLHGFRGNSFYQSSYVPLHERVNTSGFALLMPNGVRDAAGNRFWNPTDDCCERGKSGEDDVAYLAELVAEARNLRNFGHIYFFGYSNGGFMSHHMACKGLPGLRAIASLAGTSYVEDSSCEGTQPVSVLHIHGTEDNVIMYEGAETELNSDGERAFSASAQDMVTRWSQIAGCNWSYAPMHYAEFDLDEWVPGAETQAFRLEPTCGDGINIELWKGVGSGHSPAIGEKFVDALLDWVLAQD